MRSRAIDDFIDHCFLSGDEICKFQIYRSRKYENKVNPIASKLIASRHEIGLNKISLYSDSDFIVERSKNALLP